MTSLNFPVQQPALPPGFSVGKELKINRKKYQVSRILSAPAIAYRVHITHTENGSVTSERDAYVEYISCLARKKGELFDYVFEIYYWTDAGVSDSELKNKRGKFKGAVDEPDGTAIITLDELDSSKDLPMGKYNLIYIWRIERSLDPKGPLLAYKQEFSEYLNKYLIPGCIITLAGGNQYRIESFLSAEGAFGTIYKATLLATKKTVVLKFQEARSGVHEALALREFYGNQGIVGLIQAGTVLEYFNPNPLISPSESQQNPLAGNITFQQGSGQQKTIQFYCVVAEYVEGKNLVQFMNAFRGVAIDKSPSTSLSDWFENFPEWGASSKRLINLRDCVTYLEQLSDAVDFIHHRGYVHLDIKPQNIMVNKENKLQIVDMGSVSKIGTGVFAFGQGNHAAPEVKEYLANNNRTTSIWLQKFVTNIQSTWHSGVIIPDVLMNMRRLNLTEEQKKLQEQCERERDLAYRKISTQSDVFSVGAIFLSLLSLENPRQVALPDDNAPTKVGRIMMYEEALPQRRKSFLPTIKKAMSIDVKERYQSCFGLKQAIQADYTRLTYNEVLAGALVLLISVVSLLYFLIKVPIGIAVGVFGVGILGIVGWRIRQSMQKPILSAVNLIPYAITSAKLFISGLVVGAIFLTIQFSIFLYTERAFLIPGIQQKYVHQVEPDYYQVSLPKAVAVDKLVIETGSEAYQSGNYEEAKQQFQAFLRMRQDELGLTDEQIEAFDSSTTEQISKFILENPSADIAPDAILIMIIAEPSRFYETKNAVDLYTSLDTQSPPNLSVSASTGFVVISHAQADWYQVWYANNLYFAQLEGMQK